MQSIIPRPNKSADIRTDLGAILVSLEVSRSIWLITSASPEAGEKMSKYAVPGSDIAGLLRGHFGITPERRERGVGWSGRV